MISLTVTRIGPTKRFIDLDLEVNESVYQMELIADYSGVYFLSMYGEYVSGFPPFTISDYNDRTVIQWICDRAFELSEIAKNIIKKEKNECI